MLSRTHRNVRTFAPLFLSLPLCLSAAGCDSERADASDDSFRSHEGDHPNKKDKKCKPKQMGSDGGGEVCSLEGCACDGAPDSCDPGLVCDAQVCALPQPCGDGVVDIDEVCDDGNVVDDDGCDADCQPTQVQGLALGIYHTCALLGHGKVRCWGSNSNGQAGQGSPQSIGDDETPAAARNLDLDEPLSSISAGNTHTCGLADSGNVYCWGGAATGAIGRGYSASVGDDELLLGLSPVRLGDRASAMTTGNNHTCALLNSGQVRCFGSNQYRIFGYSASTSLKIGDNEIPEAAGQNYVDFDNPVVELVAASGRGNHACGRDSLGAWRCWGNNADRQVQTGGSFLQALDLIPNSLPDDTTITQLVAGGDNTCALYSTGDMLCWGRNSTGTLGRASTFAFSTNSPPSALTPIDFGGEAIARIDYVGGWRVCATTVGGSSYCWGYNAYNQLGYGNTQNVGDNELPMDVGPLDFNGATAKGFGGSRYSACVVLDNDAIHCVGYNLSGVLGYGHTNNIFDLSFAEAGPIQLF